MKEEFKYPERLAARRPKFQLRQPDVMSDRDKAQQRLSAPQLPEVMR
jgi:hypothetical protein